MKISFVRTDGQPDRVYVIRTNGTEVSWSFPSFGGYVPHDLVHLAVETAFGLRRGFWGRVDAGSDVSRINAEANRTEGSNKYAKFGADRKELDLAEILAATRWADGNLSAADLAQSIRGACGGQNLRIDGALSVARIDAVRLTLDGLCGRWAGLVPKGALNLVFDPADLERSFQLLKG